LESIGSMLKIRSNADRITSNKALNIRGGGGLIHPRIEKEYG